MTPENHHVSIAVDKNANPEVFHTAQPTFFYSVYFTIQVQSRISCEKVEDKVLKEL